MCWYMLHSTVLGCYNKLHSSSAVMNYYQAYNMARILIMSNVLMSHSRSKRQFYTEWSRPPISTELDVLHHQCLLSISANDREFVPDSTYF